MRQTAQDEAAGKAAIRKMKLIATGLLLLMVVVFAASKYFEPSLPELSWLRAFSEAAMVGALADWFAVTALFRHPLGIPIPHTAIVPSRRDEIGHMLGNFFRNNFLARNVIQTKLQQIDLIGRVTSWLGVQKNRERVVTQLVAVLPHLSEVARDEHLRPLLEQSARSAIKGADLSLIAGDLLEILIAGDKDRALRVELARIGGVLVERHQHYIKERLREEMPWYVPNFVHNKVYERLLQRIFEILTELRTSADSETSVLVRRGITELIENLKTSSYLREQGEIVKTWLFESGTLREYFTNLWQELEARMKKETPSGKSLIGEFLESALQRFARSLATDPVMRRNATRSIEHFVLWVLQRHGEEVVKLVSETVQNWETRTLVEKIELQVGKDLQYIRLNGTIVGGLAGVLIHVIVRTTGL